MKDATLTKIISDLEINLEKISKERGNLGQTKKARHLSVAITELENVILRLKEAEQTDEE